MWDMWTARTPDLSQLMTINILEGILNQSLIMKDQNQSYFGGRLFHICPLTWFFTSCSEVSGSSQIQGQDAGLWGP